MVVVAVRQVACGCLNGFKRGPPQVELPLCELRCKASSSTRLASSSTRPTASPIVTSLGATSTGATSTGATSTSTIATSTIATSTVATGTVATGTVATSGSGCSG